MGSLHIISLNHTSVPWDLLPLPEVVSCLFCLLCFIGILWRSHCISNY